MIPKFRVWNKKTESFIDYGDIMLDLKNAKVYAGDVGIPEYTIDVTKQVILMQSTGLKDKSGVEIYEGDICSVEANVWGALITRTGEVTFNEDDLQFQITSGDEWSFFTKEYFEKCEIIGNIYQNKELLEVQS